MVPFFCSILPSEPRFVRGSLFKIYIRQENAHIDNVPLNYYNGDKRKYRNIYSRVQFLYAKADISGGNTEYPDAVKNRGRLL